MLADFCSRWRNREKALIGMCHVPALPGAPQFAGDWQALCEFVLRDAQALADGGVDAIFVENFGDVPFFPQRVPAETVAHLTALVLRVAEKTGLPLGVNVLRNDACSALAIASAAAADFIRVNVLSHARLTDQGVIQSVAHDLLRARAALQATRVRICADVNVKESVPLAPGLSLEDETHDVIHRGLADAVIVSGANTGSGASLDDLKRVRAAAPATPVFVGSGVSLANIERFLPHADAFIVGTSLKIDADPRNPVDPFRVRELRRCIQ